MLRYIPLFAILCCFKANSQVTLYRGPDSVELQIGAYVDAYFGYDLNRPENKNRPYAISSSRHDEIAVNLAILQVKFSTSRSRVALSPAFGTIMEINYAQEPPLMKNLYEAYAGFRPFARRKLWLDAGIFAAPYTNESAISMDQITYTRSNGCENSPYYVSGLRGSFPISKQLKAQLFVLNGWQIIQADHHLQSFGSYLEYAPTGKLTINWSTFAGDVRTDSTPNYRNRYYTDFSVNWNLAGKSSAGFCLGGGLQDRLDTLGKMYRDNWWAGAIQYRYRLNSMHSFAIKYDAFIDPAAILVHSILKNDGVSIQSFTLNYTYKISNLMLFRIEGRMQMDKKNIYLDANNKPTKRSDLIIASIASKF